MGKSGKHIFLYHATTTGKNNETLECFKRDGIRIKSGPLKDEPGLIENSWQRSGFFVTDFEDNAKTNAHSYDDPEMRRPEEGGKPMVVMVEYDGRPGWQYDFELGCGRGDALIKQFASELERMQSDYITLSGGQVIHSIRQTKDEKGLDITLSIPGDNQLETIYYKWDSHTPLQHNVGEAELLQSMRDYLAITVGDQFLRAEQEAIKKSLLKNQKLQARSGDPSSRLNEVCLKYCGSKPPPIAGIQTFDGREWQQEELPKNLTGQERK